MNDAPPTVADDVLVRAVAAGDVAAVGLLYDRHAGLLLALAFRIVRDRAESEDVVHDAFVALSNRAGRYSSERGSVVAWLVTLTRNLAIDRTRRRDRRSAIAHDVLAHEPPPSARDAETLVALEGERVRVERALATLPAAQRRTLETAFFEGLSYPGIAEREKLPLGTIKSRAARALAALRSALATEGLRPG